MPRDCVLDFETRSVLKLGKDGTNAYRYAQHPHTGVWMACYVMVDNPDTIRTWWPGEPMPQDLRDVLEGGGRIIAHNAAFEHAIWNHLLVPRYGWPALPFEQMDDTAARAARCGLPRKLEQAAPAAGIGIEKDKAGAQQMKRMARPRKVTQDGTPTWWDVPERVERLHRYCQQDVRVQLRLHQTLPELPPREHRVWLTTMRANARGLRLDIQFIQAARQVIDAKLRGYASELRSITDGRVKGHTDLAGMKAYLADQGCPVESLNKQVVAVLKDDPQLPATVRRVLTIRAEAGKSSVAKFPAMQRHADEQGIARDQLVYYGAQATGRWCLAEDTQITVRTERGHVLEKPIQDVLLSDQVWDGDEWVWHDGVVYSGDKDVIEHDGVTATPEHVVYLSGTESSTLGDAQREGLPLWKGNTPSM